MLIHISATWTKSGKVYTKVNSSEKSNISERAFTYFSNYTEDHDISVTQTWKQNSSTVISVGETWSKIKNEGILEKKELAIYIVQTLLSKYRRAIILDSHAWQSP